MITCENGIFHLKNKHFSYIIRVDPNGQLEHLHFGAPVETTDAAALAVKPGTGWGTSVEYDADKTCLDTIPLEYSTQGTGDYREPSIILESCGERLACDLQYESYRITQEHIPMQTLPQAKRPLSSLEIILRCGSCRLKLIYTLFDTVLTRRTVLINDGAEPVRVQKLMSSCLDVFGAYRMMTFNGSWIAEAHISTAEVGRARVVNESANGFSSHHHNPAFVLYAPNATQEHGRVYGFNLIYSGNHYGSAQRSHQGLTRVLQGISDPDWTVQPSDAFETPEAVLAFSPNGFNGMSHCMHTFIDDHIVPDYWQHRERPVLYNSWEGCGFDFNEMKLLSLSKKASALGCELFVLDDGWFGARNHDRAGLGDYTVNRKKLPHGLSGLAQGIEKCGMSFGLWFEPEAVNPDSDLYRSHPEWVLNEDGRLGRNEYLLDLTKQEVRDYIVASVGSVLDSASISYVKWDMNRHSSALGSKAHAYILGLYEVLARIFSNRPEILLESCASGGNRFDLGMLCYAAQTWCSDDTDPIERLQIQEGLSYCYPPSCMGAHVSAAPHAQTLRNTPLSTRGNVASFGVLGYELDLSELLPVELDEIREQIRFYKDHRSSFQFGRFSRLDAEPGATAWQVDGAQDTVVGLFHRCIDAASGYEQLTTRQLSGKQWHVSSRPQLLRVGQYGSLLKYIMPVKLNPNGMILRVADHRYHMKDGQEDFVASGAALDDGIMLSPRFVGTGYDPNGRMQGDLSSNLFLMEPCDFSDDNPRPQSDAL